jgi:formate dehydrogenase subunit gamma
MSEPTSTDVTELFADLVGQPGALMPVLHRIQERLGCVPAEAVPAIAKALNLSRAEVHGVVTFYHDFRAAPAGRHVLKICQAEACQSMGAAALTRHAVETTGASLKHTSKDGRFTVEPVYCLGNCACSPAMMAGGKLHGRVTPERFDAIVKALA